MGESYDRHLFVPYGRPLLPNEARIANPALEQRLTEQHLQPSFPQVETLLWEIRLGLDPELQARQPVKLGKSYPLGQCLEIARAVEHRLRHIQPGELSGQAAAGLNALRRFQRAGGSFRQVWGDLRKQYFQNAFQVGSLYIDVANDTVTPTKPKVEILPFEKAGLVPIRDYQHFRQVATAYWQEPIYPNHVLPEVAPFCPLVLVGPEGRILFLDLSDYMVALTLRTQFEACTVALRGEPMPQDVFDSLAETLQSLGYRTAPDARQGRVMALRACRDYASKRWFAMSAVVKQQLSSALSLNRKLSQHAQSRANSLAPRSTQSPSVSLSMSSPNQLNVDGRLIDVETLSPEARQQLEMLRLCDQRMAELQRDVAIMQTARNAYAATLRRLISGDS